MQQLCTGHDNFVIIYFADITNARMSHHSNLSSFAAILHSAGKHINKAAFAQSRRDKTSCTITISAADHRLSQLSKAKSDTLVPVGHPTTATVQNTQLPPVPRYASVASRIYNELQPPEYDSSKADACTAAVRVGLDKVAGEDACCAQSGGDECESAVVYETMIDIVAEI